MQVFRFALPLALLLPAALPCAQLPLLEEISRQVPYLELPRAVALGDVDGDGHVDAYFSVGVDQDVVALNDGTGRLVALPGAVSAWVKGSVDAALRDFDGDGDVDALRLAGPSAQLLLGDGSGALQLAASAVPALGTIFDPEHLTAGDLDGDGLEDVLVTGPLEAAGNPSERLLLATGSGFVLQPLPHTEDESTVSALADFDLDGDLDAYVGKHYLDVILRNDGSVFTAYVAPVTFDATGSTTAVAAGDLDADGDPDLMISEGSSSVGSYVATYLGDGAGGLAPAEFVSTMVASDLVLEDFDGDGDLDAAATTGSLYVDVFGCLVYFNEGGGFFSAGVPLKKWGEWDFVSVAAADLDSDDDLDLVCAGLPDVQVYFGEGGAFVDVTAGLHAPWLSAADGSSAAAWLDVHGDGGQDILVAGREELLRLYLDDGFGRYTGAAVGLSPDPRWAACAAGLDANGDGLGDALIGYEEFDVQLSSYLELWIGGGDGTLAPAPAGTVPVVADQVRGLALGDLDGDGDADALLGLTGKNAGSWAYLPPPAQNALLLYDGAGTFHDASAQLPQQAARTQAVALGDLDGDGDLDAAVGNGDAAYLSASKEADFLYLNDGAAHFTFAPAGAFPSPLGITTYLEVADFGADGALDVLTSGAGVDNGHLYTNDGSGVFTHQPSLIGGGAIKPVDVDFDGDADVVAEGDLFLASGGQFTLSPGAMSHPVDALGTLAGDPDRDGEWDLFFVGETCRLFHGVKRQLLTLGVPQIGQPLVLVVRGPKQQPWALALALSGATVPLPGVGTLMLAPASLGVVASGVITGSKETVTFPALADPAYLGLTVYWQALVGDSPKLTNQVKTVLSAL